MFGVFEVYGMWLGLFCLLVEIVKNIEGVGGGSGNDFIMESFGNFGWNVLVII